MVGDPWTVEVFFTDSPSEPKKFTFDCPHCMDDAIEGWFDEGRVRGIIITEEPDAAESAKP